MKTYLESIGNRLMMTPHLRGIVWVLCILFCITVWDIGIHYGLKLWQLLIILFKVA
ncbi:Uncharacterised protein [Klebsiella pneumoniae]|nr:Uncharacterised protein [Klebsiella pneumoniae]